jgi:ribosomal protein S18 acetylase RimI-like enzyme
MPFYAIRTELSSSWPLLPSRRAIRSTGVNEIEIRLATSDDVQQLISLRRQFTYEDESGEERAGYEDECRSFLEEALATGQWRLWLACVGPQIVSHLFVAFIDKVPRPTRENRKIAYLTNMYTVPDYRNRGLGGRLLAAAQKDAANGGVELMIVWPSDASVGFYRSFGFDSERDPLVWYAHALPT